MPANRRFTDSTGEGMAGATDANFEPQQGLKTLYNGSKKCACGCDIGPIDSMTSSECTNCSRRKKSTLLKNRMSK